MPFAPACALVCCLQAPSFAQAPGVTGDDRPAAGPVVAAVTALSARPAALSVGSAGPINRVALDLLDFAPDDGSARLLCSYPRLAEYRCAWEFAAEAAQGPRRRVIVSIPDLDRGNRVTVRLSNRRGETEVGVDLANAPQIVHEIEALALPEGGRISTNSQGERAPLTQLSTRKATTVPALAHANDAGASACERIVPHWVAASATDPVFSSSFGPLHGTVLLSRPATAGSPVRPENLPEWLITYPLSATRVQFIAHYEVIYRVEICAERVERT